MKFTIILALLCTATLSHCAHAAQTHEWQVNLTRGSSNVFVRMYKGSTKEAAEQACAAGVPRSIATAITYTCNAARQVFVVSPDPVTPPPPPPVPATSKLLSWTPPTQNTDGSALTNLAGYRINYGNSLQAMTQSIDVMVPGATAYRVLNLAAGQWYFAVRALNSEGTESSQSAIVSAVVTL